MDPQLPNKCFDRAETRFAHNAGLCPLWVKSRHLQCTSRCPLSATSGHMPAGAPTADTDSIHLFDECRKAS